MIVADLDRALSQAAAEVASVGQQIYIGQFTDDSGLDYLNARYYSSDRGQFLSEEPIFLNIGDANQVKQLSQQDQQTYLADPQQLNSYSYGRDNPITRKDPNGKFPALAVAAPFIAPEVIIPAAIITGAAVGNVLSLPSVVQSISLLVVEALRLAIFILLAIAAFRIFRRER
jgi:RHS repeat-associated protein